MEKFKQSSGSGAALVFAAGALWGTMGIFVRKLAFFSFSSMQIVWLRFFSAAIIIAVGMLIYNKKLFKIKLSDIWCFIGTGIFSVAFFTYFYFMSIMLISMSAAAVLLYTAPVFVMILSAILYKEKITFVKIIACIAAFCGCLFTSGLIGTGKTLAPLGIITGILSGIGYALYSIFGKYAVQKKYNSLTITFYTFLIACIGITPLCDVSALVRNLSINPICVLIAFVMGLFSAALPYVLYTMGLERIESGKAAVIASVEPVIATVIGFAVYGEKTDIFAIIGIMLIISVVILLSFFENKRDVKA